ncbi:MAG: DUF4922 domain-containing protein [Prevotellaceae bacterium]|jgi:hypothetical protein|nr:DUF4922 domain-containing protein [Prevotellaceae bacterium]
MAFEPIEIDTFFDEQLDEWQTARDNYAALARMRTRSLLVDDVLYKVQFNPARIGSTAAQTDARSIGARPCFLCRAHRPPEQRSLSGVLGKYEILVNPYPIFPRHLTIPLMKHRPQSLVEEGAGIRFGDLLTLAKLLPAFTLFYNGARSGASAPDHLHFQAGSRGVLPIEEARYRSRFEQHARFIDTDSKEEAIARFSELFRSLRVSQEGAEPMLNILCWYHDGQWTVSLFPRKKFRPACYHATGSAQLLCSPAAVEMGGLIILPRAEDFEKITATDIHHIIREVCKP